MAKQYSVKGFLHALNDYSLVKQYFHKNGIPDFQNTKPTPGDDEKVDDSEVIETIISIIQGQKEPVQQQIDRDFSVINSLSDNRGVENLLAEAQDQGFNSPADIATESNGHEVSFWFFNNKKDIFNGANIIQEFPTSGWKRVPVPNRNVSVVEKMKQSLEDALRKYHQSKDLGTGQRCLVDVYTKQDRVYVVAYVSTRATNDVVPDDKDATKLKKSIRRDSKEIYYLYLQGENNKDGGELQIKTRGGFKTEKELLSIFSQVVLGHELDDTKQKYDLELLKDRNFALVFDHEDEVENWWLKGIDLRTPNKDAKFKIQIRDEARTGTESLWKQLDALKLSGKMGKLYLDRVDLKIKFKPTTKHPRGTKTFYVTWKDTSSLNDIDDLDIKAGAILKKSNIDRGFSQ